MDQKWVILGLQMKIPHTTILLFLLSACSGKLTPTSGEGEATTSEIITGDTVVANAEEVDPGGTIGDDTEICDGIDNDGDGEIDEGLLVSFFWDMDADGWGASNGVGCEVPEGAVLISGDCEDDNPAVHPEAEELCNDVDDNCDGQIDEGLSQTFYADLDGDGYGTPTEATSDCMAPDGYVDNADDCDDTASVISPDSLEICNYQDDNCNGVIDEDLQTLVYPDMDGDGFGLLAEPALHCGTPAGYSTTPGDCADDDDTRHPMADEHCNGIDDDCDGLIDDSPVSGTILFWADMDGDGHGYGEALAGCSPPPEGYSESDDDCDDMDASRSPSSPEVCNDRDDNCNGTIDEGAISLFYEDNDGDGYGTTSVWACAQPPGTALYGEDCDDTRSDVYPGAEEICDSLDSNCNGLIDEDPSDGTLWFPDDDGDDYGDPAAGERRCYPPDGYVLDNTDCDPDRSDVHPMADELCNGRDDDCDGTTDEDPIDSAIWFLDSDGDGFGMAETTSAECVMPTGYVADGSDCNDDEASIAPGMDEYCDGIDNDCDGMIDDAALDRIPVYPDEDEDGDGAITAAIWMCADDLSDGWSTTTTDCDDEKDWVYPGADELCNGIDDDCDGSTDEEAIDMVAVYPDGDIDGYGSGLSSVRMCQVDPGWSLVNTDCDDGNPGVYPGAEEVCNDVDDDCNGSIDEDAIDGETLYVDADGDGFGSSASSTLSCEMMSGWSTLGTDCDDDEDLIYPGAEETCDGYDEDCDGVVDNDADDCPCTQHNYGPNSYWFCTANKKWNNAKNWCAARDYALVTVNSGGEQIWLIDMIRDHWSVDNDPYWIGLNDRDHERGYSRDDWIWASGEAYTYEAFRSGQPDNWGNEDCVEINRWDWASTEDNWNDLNCNESQNFICEARP
jgi:hypothetical protein